MKRRKVTKPASEAQKRARERNWNKGQTKCLVTMMHTLITSATTKPSEITELTDMSYRLNQILIDWKK